MKTCVGIFAVAFVACLCALVGSTSNAHAVTCSFGTSTATADGQAQTINLSADGCTETASGTGPEGSTVGGFLHLGTGVISGTLQTKGNATVQFSGGPFFSVNAVLPAFNQSGQTIQVGNMS